MTNTLKATTNLSLPLFNKELTAKVDTGATTCCLHGTEVSIDKATNMAVFSNPELSQNVIRIPLIHVVDVHSADNGAAPRPVVALDITINGQQFEQVEFNINDRSEMDCKVLIGQNLLKMGNFVVDVTEATSEPVIQLELPSEDPEDGIDAIRNQINNHHIMRNVVYDQATDSYTFTVTRDALTALLSLTNTPE